MTQRRKAVLVIGYGNPLRSDDGFGWRVARSLEEGGCGDDVEISACHQLTPEMAGDVAERDLVIFVDVEVGRAPGEVSRRGVGPEPPRPMAFGHSLEPPGLLALARELFGGCPEAMLISTGGETFEFGENLSPSVEAAVKAAAEEVRRSAAEVVRHRSRRDGSSRGAGPHDA